jgi:hypothetical protein
VSSIAESADILSLLLLWQFCPISAQLMHLPLHTVMPRLRVVGCSKAARAIPTCQGADGGAGCHDDGCVGPGGRLQALQRRHPLPEELRAAACFCS